MGHISRNQNGVQGKVKVCIQGQVQGLQVCLQGQGQGQVLVLQGQGQGQGVRPPLVPGVAACFAQGQVFQVCQEGQGLQVCQEGQGLEGQGQGQGQEGRHLFLWRGRGRLRRGRVL